MEKKTASAIMLTLLLTSMLTLAFNIQTAKAESELQIIIGTTDSVEGTLDPAQAYDYFGWCIMQQISATLVSVAPNSSTGADFEPNLAQSWNVSSDLLTWDFTLRQGVTFPDGTVFNATHVKYSFDRAIDLIPSIPEGAPAGLEYNRIINRTDVLSTYKVRFSLNFPFSPFLGILACRASAIVDPKYAPIAQVDYTAGDPRASTSVAFIGPYNLSRWERVAGRDIEIRLDANPHYWNATSGYPKIKHIIFRFYSDSSSLRSAIDTGDVDMAFRHISPTDVLDLEDDPSVKVWWGTGSFIQYLCFQTKRAPFNDTRVRVAVAAALNKSLVCQTVFLGLASPLYSIIPPGMLGHTEAFKELGDANYTLTRSLLAELGYNEANKLKFDLWYESSGHYPMSAEQALLYKEAIEGSGVVEVTLKSADWSSYRSNRNAEIMDAFVYGWYPDYVDPDDYSFLYWASWLRTNYSNATQVALYDHARATTNLTRRAELYAQIDDIAIEQCSVVPLYVGMSCAVTKPNIHGVCLDITQDMRYWLLYIAEAEPKTWTVDDDGPADFHTIQEAINAANPGDTVFVKSGIYVENVVVNKSLSLVGEDLDTCVVDGNVDYYGIFAPIAIKVQANDVNITGFTIRNEGFYGDGVVIYESSNTRFFNNLVARAYWDGARLVYSSNNQLLNNTITKCGGAGIRIFSSNSNKVSDNIVTEYGGILLSRSSDNTLSGNSITDGWWGFSFSESSNNYVLENNVINNSQKGLELHLSSSNKFYHNNFINNTIQVDVDGFQANIWDDGYPSSGNYWSDYVGVDVKSGPNQALPGSDSIGDTPYIIDANNTDHYPLMNPYGAPPPPAYSLTITATVGGTTDPAAGTYGYTANSTVQVTATPDANYLFDYWELDSLNVGAANPYSVLMDKNHTLKAVFSLIPPPLQASISPLSASILVGQSVTFTSTVSGGYTPYSYQWYLNGNPVSGATSNTWTFTPTTGGIYYIHLKVTDAKANTAQSDTARITAATVPVGGYSFPIQVQTKAEPLLPYIASIAALTAIFTKLRPKAKRKR
jgi:peptide/nickel transport system substrate-binding protein